MTAKIPRPRDRGPRRHDTFALLSERTACVTTRPTGHLSDNNQAGTTSIRAAPILPPAFQQIGDHQIFLDLASRYA